MWRVRRAVHGPAAGLTAPQKDGRPGSEATLDRAATLRPSFLFTRVCGRAILRTSPRDGVLRSSAIIQNQDVGKGPSRVQPFFASYASACTSERVWAHSTSIK